MSTPMNSSGASAPNYSTNVNRSKTKKWVEAKPVDYGGDEWGADEYDDDDLYEPAPPPKPTGLRQKGQAMQQTVSSDTGKKSYGDLPALPGQNQPRSSTGPVPMRKNSFNQGDEKRAFSSNGPMDQSPVSPPITGSPITGQRAGAPSLQVSTQQQPTTGLRKASQTELPPADISASKLNTRASEVRPESQSDLTPQTATASTASYSDDIQTRRDYSPSAVPAPLSAISLPQNSSEPNTHFPLRKSSLSQQLAPDLSDQQLPDSAARPWSDTARSSSPGVVARTSYPQQDSSGAKPWNETRAGSPGMQSTRSPISPPTQKPLPFVRPADIYKRMAEERERERQSLDSSRPSMESLASDSLPDRSFKATDQPSRGSANPEDHGAAHNQGGSDKDTPGLHSTRGLMSVLEPVQERKSEYGFDGLNSKSLPLHSRETSVATQSSASGIDNTTFADNRFSRSPELPDLNRLSGFGDDFFSPVEETHPSTSGPSRNPAEEASLPQTQGQHDRDSINKQNPPRTEPSLGFRMTVNTAFENANSVPPTPSSRLGGSVERSDSESTGTTGISPIMSRAPGGTAPAEARSREAEAREARTPTIAEVNEPDSRHHSAANEVPPVRQIVLERRISSKEEGALTPPARPRAERDDSFRPILPGSWHSYATNASDRIVQSEVPPPHETTEDEKLDATPTATKHPLPLTPSSAAVASAPLDGMATSTAAPKHPLAQIETTVSESSQMNYASKDDGKDMPSPSPLKAKTNTALSTESKPSDDENDRLRKEIVKSLSPRPSNVGPDSALSDAEEGLPNNGGNVRESYYLPSEYDNYWDEQDGGVHEEQGAVASASQETKDKIAPIPPLAARKTEELPETAERRFSWEADGEQLATNSAPSSNNHAQSPIVELPTPAAPLSDVATDRNTGAKAVVPAPASSETQTNLLHNSRNDKDTTSGSEAYIGEAALVTGGLATGAIYDSKDATRENEPTPNLHLSSHEDEFAHPLSSSPVYPLEHASTDPAPHSASSTIDHVSSADRNENTLSHTQRLSLSLGTSKGQYTTNTTLKELLQIPNPYDRIRACGDVQSKILAADSGLDEWLTAMKAENPEYADIDGNYGGSTPFVASSSTRSKFSKALNPNSNTLQQPYYQQYLNASSPTSPLPPTQRPTTNSGGYAPAGSQHGGLSGFSGGGSKITTQQVQARSKELLHTAGIFGGKGMKAGKGLLAKGKSRFASRGAGGPGGSDKIRDANSTITGPASGTRTSVFNQRSFAHKRNNTADTISRSFATIRRGSEDSLVTGEQEIPNLRKRSTLGFGNSGRSSRFGSLAITGKLSRLGRPGKLGVLGNRKPKDDHRSAKDDRVGFASDMRGVHEMHFKKSDSSAPILPAITVNSKLESPTRALSMDSSALAAREEYHRHKRSESGLSHHSKSGSAMSGTKRDMSFFLADDVSDQSRDGSVSYGESDENFSYGVAKPAPISKFQPTWDPYTASPILEGEEESPLSRHGTSIVKLIQQTAAPPLVAAADSSNTAPPTMPGASSKTPAESPIIGHPALDDEPEGWVMVCDTQPDGTVPAPPIPPRNRPPSTIPPPPPPPPPPPTSKNPEPPLSHGPSSLGSAPLSNVEHVDPGVDHHGVTQNEMKPTERETAPSEISLESDVEPQEEQPLAAPVARFISTEMTTPDEVESPIIPNIFRTIKGDPPAQHARTSGREKLKGQDSPKFSLPPIKRSSTFGNLMSGWPGVPSRSGSKASRVSRKSPLGDGSDGEQEEVPPMPPTPGLARPGTSESARRAQEKMKAVSVAESDEQPEENHTIGALVAAGLVAGIFGDEKPSPITPTTQATFLPPVEMKHAPDSEEEMSQVGSENLELISGSVGSPDTQIIEEPKETIESPDGDSTVMLPVLPHEQKPEVPARPSTPAKGAANPAITQITPDPRPQTPEQSTPTTLVDESRAPDRLSKSSEQWVENAPVVDSYVLPPIYPPPNYPPPSRPGPRSEHLSIALQESQEAREYRRSQRPGVRIETTPNPSPRPSNTSSGLSTRANFNSSPLQHRSLPLYESPRVYIAPSTVRQTYNGMGSFQALSPPSENQEQSPRDLPEHMYQAPITKHESFLPRQQISEYQIAGVGPPLNEAPLSATRSIRRSSAFLKDIGGKLSGTESLALEDSTIHSSPSASRNNGTNAASVSSVTSEDIREKIRNQSRPSSLFGLGSGTLSRSSTNNANSVSPSTSGIGNGIGSGENGEFRAIKPSRRESMITHRAGSWKDAVEEDARSPVSPLVPGGSGGGKERKGARAFFGNVSSRPIANVKGAGLADNNPTASVPNAKGKGIKKPRFSVNFGGLLGRGSAGKNKESVLEEHPPPTPNSATSIQRTPIEYRPRNKSLGQLPILARPFQTRINKNPRTDENHERADSEERSGRRRASAHALLTGPLPPAYSPPINNFGGQSIEEERDPEKENFSMHVHPAHRPAPRQAPIFIEQVPDRGRRKNKEPQYDTPPIPGAYNLVRGDGNSASPTTYDPHGRNSNLGFGGQPLPQNVTASHKRSSFDTNNSRSPPVPPIQQGQRQIFSASYKFPPSDVVPRDNSQSSLPQFDGSDESPWADSTNEALVGLKNGLGFGEDGRITWQQSRTRRNVSREDLLARSPARPTHGQQRPYQLSLPEEEENTFHGRKDYSTSRSASTSVDNREDDQGSGLGLGIGGGEGSQRGRKYSAGTARYLGLHPDLKRPDTEQNYQQENDMFSPVSEATPRDIGSPSLSGEALNTQLLLSPNSAQDVDLARSNSEVSQMSRNVISPVPSGKRSMEERSKGPETNLEHISGNAQRGKSPIPIQIGGIDIGDDANIYDASPVRSSYNRSVTPVHNNRAMEPEEKIVDVYNQGRSDIVELPAGNDEDEDKVTMTATSYPGQEWNPYAYGEMEYD